MKYVVKAVIDGLIHYKECDSKEEAQALVQECIKDPVIGAKATVIYIEPIEEKDNGDETH